MPNPFPSRLCTHRPGSGPKLETSQGCKDPQGPAAVLRTLGLGKNSEAGEPVKQPCLLLKQVLGLAHLHVGSLLHKSACQAGGPGAR